MLISRISSRCGNVAAVLELDEHLAQEYKVFHHAQVVSHHRSLSFTPLSPMS